ncbi:hypothetical protein DWW84_04525 [Bifidobacterium pseudocatenulatum]|uniref:Uncharacterized protein n=1 Tax=Bifidobacterium pseudocatenulatum TaxID=28026 RepID=A0A3E5HS40_BIFPS|nr:hypothetical protein CWS99_01695 [Bifidobacterium pseudocatenulatum]NEY12719.1 hypothetical protein [Bifidobacterium pseudocatenulatum]RGI74264.1 hypothetical protein DXD87_04355 [Bifidobacterium pseudocatenulatum]RGJ12636.1 hypothetical protein DXD75_02035 [Bifidobacterium pseudocatenulatum]RGJ16559.1 hypothetical protein DXD71_05465 [Bifidobacterium pseudocatenulatum]
MGSLKVLDGEWEKRFEGPRRETQQSTSISPALTFATHQPLVLANTETQQSTRKSRRRLAGLPTLHRRPSANRNQLQSASIRCKLSRA